MNELFDFWIEKIYVIVKKDELPGFDFENICREWHGFVLITNGNGTFFSSGKTLNLKRGSAVLLNKGCRYRMRLENGGSYITTAFDFGFADNAAENIFPQVCSFSEDEILKAEEICKKWNSDRYAAVTECRIELTMLCKNLFSQITDNAFENVDKDIAKALSFIRQNFKRNFSSDEISKFCNLSKSYLRSKFSRALGMSVTDYRETLRIHEAENMLKSGFFSVKEIAQELGYCDVFHFTKKFTKFTNTPPATYKKSFCTKQ